MKKFVTTAVAAALVSVSAFAATETFNVDRSHSEATFRVKHMMSRVSGRFDDFTGKVMLDREKPGASSVEFTIKAASINTGAEGRDKHLRSADFFEAEKYPEITFKSTSVEPTKTKDLYNVTGDFTMHGVTKRITLPVEFLGFAKGGRGNEIAGFAIASKLNRKDYGINWNRALDQGGYLLSDEVDIYIALETVKPAAAPPATTTQ